MLFILCQTKTSLWTLLHQLFPYWQNTFDPKNNLKENILQNSQGNFADLKSGPELPWQFPGQIPWGFYFNFQEMINQLLTSYMDESKLCKVDISSK